jgi:hypothetical protein
LGQNLQYNTFSILEIFYRFLSIVNFNFVSLVSKHTKDFGHDSVRGEEKKKREFAKLEKTKISNFSTLYYRCAF